METAHNMKRAFIEQQRALFIEKLVDEKKRLDDEEKAKEAKEQGRNIDGVATRPGPPPQADVFVSVEELSARIEMVAYCIETGFEHYHTLSTDCGLPLEPMVKELGRRWAMQRVGGPHRGSMYAEEKVLAARFVRVIQPVAGVLGSIFPSSKNATTGEVEYRLGLFGRALVYCVREHVPVVRVVAATPRPIVELPKEDRVVYFHAAARRVLHDYEICGSRVEDSALLARFVAESRMPSAEPRMPAVDEPVAEKPRSLRDMVVRMVEEKEGRGAAALLDPDFAWARGRVAPLPLPVLPMLTSECVSVLQLTFGKVGRAVNELVMRFREAEMQRASMQSRIAAVTVARAATLATMYLRVARMTEPILACMHPVSYMARMWGADSPCAVGVDHARKVGWEAWYYAGFFSALAGDVCGAEEYYKRAFRATRRMFRRVRGGGELLLTLAVECIYVAARVAAAWPRLVEYADVLRSGLVRRDARTRRRFEPLVEAAYERAAANRDAVEALDAEIDDLCDRAKKPSNKGAECAPATATDDDDAASSSASSAGPGAE
jgi:hypothetical protein